MPESRNSGIGSEVDFVGNQLLRRLHNNSYPIPRQPIVRFCLTTEVCSWTDKLNPSRRCSLLSWQRILLRRWLNELTDSQESDTDRLRRLNKKWSNTEPEDKSLVNVLYICEVNNCGYTSEYSNKSRSNPESTINYCRGNPNTRQYVESKILFTNQRNPRGKKIRMYPSFKSRDSSVGIATG
jgi:hypothetical protein